MTDISEECKPTKDAESSAIVADPVPRSLRKMSGTQNGFLNVVLQASTTKGASSDSEASGTAPKFIKTMSTRLMDPNGSSSEQRQKGTSSWSAASSLVAKMEFDFYRSFVPRAAVRTILNFCQSRPAATELIAEETDAAVLIVDISGFTSLCDRFQACIATILVPRTGVDICTILSESSFSPRHPNTRVLLT
jgi:hypothetical protein